MKDKDVQIEKLERRMTEQTISMSHACTIQQSMIVKKFWMIIHSEANNKNEIGHPVRNLESASH